MIRVIVLGAQVPFTRGGAEILVESLVDQINKLDGFEAEIVHIPFKWYPEEQMLNEILAWRLLDLSEANGKKIDLIIATKFPTYAIQHPNKILWLVHQHRTLYDLENSEYDHWGFSPDCKLIRDKIRSLDNLFFAECQKIYTISRTTANRLLHFNQIEGVPLFPPPLHAEKIQSGDYGDKILYLGRLEPNKRPDLLVKAVQHCKHAKILIAGKGREEDHKRLENLIHLSGIENRCELLGYLSDEALLQVLSEARAVFYAPVDEDYGYATVEAFLAHKPVITCNDSGEVQLFVKDTGAGYISIPEASHIAENLYRIYAHSESELKEIAYPGYKLAKTITWDKVMDELVFKNL